MSSASPAANSPATTPAPVTAAAATSATAPRTAPITSAAVTSTPSTAASTATYPYGAYSAAYMGHPMYTQAGAYAAQPGSAGGYQYMYQPGVTGYWPYQYSYPPHHIYTPRIQTPQAATAAPSTTTTHAAAASTSTPNATAPRQSNFYTSSQFREPAPANTTSGTRSTRKQSNMKGLFAKELKSLMYGFGDDRNPAGDTVNVMEDILVEYIMDVCQVAGGPTRKGRLSIEDLRRALSLPADAKKLARMEELLFMQEDIKRARAQFNDTEVPQSRSLL